MKHLSIFLGTTLLLAAIAVTGSLRSVLASAPAQAPTNPSESSSELQDLDGFYFDGPTQMQATLGRQEATVNPQVHFDGPTQMATTFSAQEPIAAEIISAPSASTRYLSFEPQDSSGIHFDGPTQMQAVFGK